MSHVHRARHAANILPRVPVIKVESADLNGGNVIPVDHANQLMGRAPPTGAGGGGGDTSSSDLSSDDTGSDSGSSDTSSSSSTASSSSSSSSSSTDSKDKPEGGDNNTIPIVLGIVIPIAVAVVVFFFLHRRHVRKLRTEDANDKHRSLDFGLGAAEKPLPSQKKSRFGKSPPNVSVSEKEIAARRQLHDRGVSMDYDLGSPYVLPPGLQSSHESLHSMSRAHPSDDRYRPATTFIPNDTSGVSMRSYPPHAQRGPDDSSVYTGSGSSRDDGMQSGLLRNASRMSQSNPPIPAINVPEPAPARKEVPAPPPISKDAAGLLPPGATDESRDSFISENGSDRMRRSHNYLGAMINERTSSLDIDKPQADKHESHELDSQPRRSLQLDPALHPAMDAPAIMLPDGDQYQDDASDYGDDTVSRRDSHALQAHPRPETQTFPTRHDSVMPDSEHADPIHNLDAPGVGYDLRRLSMGMRPLPPDDPTDDPESRANKIRSFYKEYFDDSKPGPAPAHEDYYEDYGQEYGQEYLGDAAFFDPETGQFIMAGAPYADPVTRRAMTPPPRAPPRFRGGHQYAPSAGFMSPHAPRAFSSASARGPGARRGAGGKPLPPPTPLRVLPTPHMLKEDSFALPVDFAPPSTARDRRAGTPNSPRGGVMPYSPSLPSVNTLVSSFDDLAVMPSPHALRRSGTFTALDFAPPPRLKIGEEASDAGSIKSNRTGMSSRGLYNIRTGAYRLSRLPKETVGTKGDIASSLKPSWDIGR